MNKTYIYAAFAFSHGMILHELGCELTSVSMFILVIMLFVFGVKTVERWEF